MANQRTILDTLIAMVKQGYEIASIVGSELAAKITEIAQMQNIEVAETEIIRLMLEYDIDEEEIALNKEFRKLDIESDLSNLKRKMGK
ncbi:hypothetical protein [uncultured Microscilla sp.]|uniref:hypothetical protein n=1 Tax=uncultured Microscilla sp. TaxID=432653 RepID=UPI00262E420C|nr:hypothetical protein [uncultured Microscilla sp.]